MSRVAEIRARHEAQIDAEDPCSLFSNGAQAHADRAALLVRVAELESHLKSAAAWVKHWQADVECGLNPTTGSLADAAQEIAVALKGGAA